MTTIYVVMGTTGEYSDRTEWPVRAYHTEAAAQAEVLRLDAYVREHKPPEYGDAGIDHDYPKFNAALEAYKVAINDESFHQDYTGTSYYIYNVPLVEEPADAR